MAYRIRGKIRFFFLNDDGGRTSRLSELDEITTEKHADDAIKEAIRKHLGARYSSMDEFDWIEGPTVSNVGDDIYMRMIGAPSLFDGTDDQ